MQRAITLTVRGETMRGMEHFPDDAKHPLPAVILYHGFTANKLQEHRMFLKLCRELESQGTACFRFDFLGSGESDGNFEQMTVSREVAEGIAVLDSVRADARVDPSNITLVGMSMGGLVAGMIAGDRATQVHNLVLLCPAGNMRELIMADQRNADDTVTKTAVPDVFDHGGNLIGSAFLYDLTTIDGFARARPFRGATLIVHGTRDLSVSPEIAARYQTTAFDGRATVHLVEGADHTFNSHAWETELISTVTAFLRGVQRGV